MKKVLIIILVAVLVKLTYFVFASSFGWNDSTFDTAILKKNDAFWYEKIAVDGHEKITPDQLGKCEEGNIEQSYYAFFPLYPFTIRAIMTLSNWSFDNVAFLLSVLFSIGLFVLFYYYVRNLLNSEKQAFIATLLLILLPFHFYFSMFYTESLFLLLLIGAFYSIDLKKHWLTILTTVLLVWVRPNGLFMLVPLFIYFIERNYSSDFRQLFSRNWKEFLPGLIFAFPVIAFVGYCFYLQSMTGDFFAYKTAQAGWCRETVFPWTPIFRAESPTEFFKIGYLGFFGLFALWNVKKIPFSYFVLLGIGLLVPLVANSITIPRFIIVLFPFVILFAKPLKKINNTALVIVLVLLFAIQLYTFSFWLNGGEFSY